MEAVYNELRAERRPSLECTTIVDAETGLAMKVMSVALTIILTVGVMAVIGSRGTPLFEEVILEVIVGGAIIVVLVDAILFPDRRAALHHYPSAPPRWRRNSYYHDRYPVYRDRIIYRDRLFTPSRERNPLPGTEIHAPAGAAAHSQASEKIEIHAKVGEGR